MFFEGGHFHDAIIPSGHYRPASESETPLEWRFAGRLIVARFFMFTGISFITCAKHVRVLLSSGDRSKVLGIEPSFGSKFSDGTA